MKAALAAPLIQSSLMMFYLSKGLWTTAESLSCRSDGLGSLDLAGTRSTRRRRILQSAVHRLHPQSRISFLRFVLAAEAMEPVGAASLALGLVP